MLKYIINIFYYNKLNIKVYYLISYKKSNSKFYIKNLVIISFSLVYIKLSTLTNFLAYLLINYFCYLLKTVILVYAKYLKLLIIFFNAFL
jgi:hypothetical protein